MTGPTIQEIKQSAPESLWHFLEQLPSSMEAQQFYGLLIAGTLGILAHYLMKYLYGETLFRKRFKKIIASWLMFVGSCAGLVAVGTFTGDQGGFTGWFSVLVQGFTAGLGIDALANKGGQVAWTPEQREKKLGPSVAAESTVAP